MSGARRTRRPTQPRAADAAPRAEAEDVVQDIGPDVVQNVDHDPAPGSGQPPDAVPVQAGAAATAPASPAAATPTGAEADPVAVRLAMKDPAARAVASLARLDRDRAEAARAASPQTDPVVPYVTRADLEVLRAQIALDMDQRLAPPGSRKRGAREDDLVTAVVETALTMIEGALLEGTALGFVKTDAERAAMGAALVALGRDKLPSIVIATGHKADHNRHDLKRLVRDRWDAAIAKQSKWRGKQRRKVAVK